MTPGAELLRETLKAIYAPPSRNLSPDAFKLALGRRYNRVKKAVGKPAGTILGQIDPISTAAKLATEHSVSEATVKRAGKFAEEVAAEAQVFPGAVKLTRPPEHEPTKTIPRR